LGNTSAARQTWVSNSPSETIHTAVSAFDPPLLNTAAPGILPSAIAFAFLSGVISPSSSMFHGLLLSGTVP
jgi:hypothetical protein